jgi:antitoxin (DNA-binding transcriptional repressor) of toxin-antitoxin stability system
MYMIQLSLSEARKILPSLARMAEAGEVVVLFRHGKPVAQMVRVGETAAVLSREEARILLRLREGRILQAGRPGPLLPRRWKPGRHGGGLTGQILRDRGPR